ncbi:hypothetical protein GCM10007886_36860 [Methylobacterium gregans]|nr:hypothetical protein GCM10007886_36860 [Methylobacterium gregans]
MGPRPGSLSAATSAEGLPFARAVCPGGEPDRGLLISVEVASAARRCILMPQVEPKYNDPYWAGPAAKRESRESLNLEFVKGCTDP